jgi:hypothetical protein
MRLGLVYLIETRQTHEKSKTILDLRPDTVNRCYDVVARAGVSDKEWQRAASGTVVREANDFWLDAPRRPEETGEPALATGKGAPCGV